MTNNSAHRFLFSLIWPQKASGRHKSTLVERLGDLRATKNDFLTEDEFQQIRSELLQELTTFAQTPFAIRFVFIAFSLFGIAGIFYCWHIQLLSASWIFVFTIAVALVMWRRTEQVYTEKGALSLEGRLTSVDELLRAGLISADEAIGLRKSIDLLFEKRNEAQNC